MDLGRLALILGIGVLAYYLLQSKPTTPVPSQPASSPSTGSPPSSQQTSIPTTSVGDPNLPPCPSCPGAAHGDICLCAGGNCYPVGPDLNIVYACSYGVDSTTMPGPHLWIDTKTGRVQLPASHGEIQKWYYTDGSPTKLCFNQ